MSEGNGKFQNVAPVSGPSRSNEMVDTAAGWLLSPQLALVTSIAASAESRTQSLIEEFMNLQWCDRALLKAIVQRTSNKCDAATVSDATIV